MVSTTSSLLGASMVNPKKLFFGVFGDLLFFYDMNTLGNRDIKSNVRILVVNNGLGQEFKNYSCEGSKFGEEADLYVSERGHYGRQSPILIKSYVEALGFKYLSASTKEELEDTSKEYLSPQMGDNPIVSEAFTQTEDENKALEMMTLISIKSKMMIKVKNMLQNEHLCDLKNIIKRLKNNKATFVIALGFVKSLRYQTLIK